ncbi:hypothetical protein EDC02_5150 [Micromonospora sp. Llam0]|uniref:hypothetical protein n=1 Tax=Micromonospora sp. Llam0 TaxID=2485143 RepID=UPI000F980381|nr:hypothetical protein [Micromonospora sp. Llam0]ROO63133.1 hypothetical protein EDC02_5150 [Micromonospora sp. Llam0]
MRRYVVTLTNGMTRTVTADRHRYVDGSVVFEIRRYDDSLPCSRRWQEIWVVPEAELAVLDPPDREPTSM